MSLLQKPKVHREALADREDGQEGTAGRLGPRGKGREEAHRKLIIGAEVHLMALLAAAIRERVRWASQERPAAENRFAAH